MILVILFLFRLILSSLQKVLRFFNYYKYLKAEILHLFVAHTYNKSHQVSLRTWWLWNIFLKLW